MIMKGDMLELELVVRQGTGALCGAYLKLRAGKVARTEEIESDVLLADYDRQGNLLGIDILAPIDMSVAVNLVKDRRQRAAIESIMQSTLRDLLQAA